MTSNNNEQTLPRNFNQNQKDSNNDDKSKIVNGDDDVESSMTGKSDETDDDDDTTYNNNDDQNCQQAPTPAGIHPSIDIGRDGVNDADIVIVVNDDLIMEDNDKDGKQILTASGKLTFVKTVIILTTWATSGAVVAIPWSFGILGYVLGPLLLIGVMCFMMTFLLFLLKVADDSSSSTRTFGDVGYHLAGDVGRTLFTGFQITNLVFYMPVALETVGLSMEYIFKGDCLGYWNIITFVGLYVFIQFMQCWEHVSWLGYVTVAMVIVKSFGLLPYSYVEYQDEAITSIDYQQSHPFGNNGSETWYDLSMAISTLFYAFTPIFVLMEVRHDMKEPRQCKNALIVSCGIQMIIYIVAGVTCVVLWGSNVADPITLQIPYSWVGYVLNIFLVVAVSLDYAISGKVVNDLFRSKCFPTEWSMTTTNRPKVWQQLVVTAPLSIFSLIMPLAIPNFTTLIGILTGVTIIGTNSWMITLAWEFGSQKYHANRLMMWSGAIIGLLVMLWVIAGAIYEVVTADYSSDFFCSGY